MDARAREQVRLILDDLTIRTKKATETRVRRIYAENNARGMLRSGATIKGVVTALEEIGAGFIATSVDQVAAIAKDIEAFAMVQESVEALLRVLEAKASDSAETAVGPDPNGSPAVVKAANDLYTESKAALRRQLEIHRFSFTVPFSPQLPEAVEQTPTRKNRGGKPLAAHWDELWATIAVSIYSGDLQPKTQADIERWMSGWLVDHDLDASVSSVRQRARMLWRKLDSAE